MSIGAESFLLIFYEFFKIIFTALKFMKSCTKSFYDLKSIAFIEHFVKICY